MKLLLVFTLTLSVALCSTDNGNFKPFIVGGSDAAPEQFPFLSSLRRTSDRTHLCGGGIINARWILTAAHCITGSNIVTPDEIYNVVGTVSRTSDEGSWYETERFVIYPEYDEILNRHDIALVQTVEYMEFNLMIQPLGVLPDRYDGGENAIIVGFGQTNDIPRSDVKQYLQQTSISNADCRRAYQFNPFNAVRVFDTNICFSSQEGTSVCDGDSGGSIVIDFYGKFISLGIVSWASEECGTAHPDVYTRTSFYYNFIRNVTEIIRGED